jgi:alkane 1-monooxygenase
MKFDRAALNALIRHPATAFALASVSPLLFLVIGALAGGVWAFLGWAWITIFLALADRIARRLGQHVPSTEEDSRTRGLLLAVGILHFPALVFAAWALGGGTGLGPFGWMFAFLGFGLWFGQVSNSAAHELIHRTERPLFRLGMWIYISLLFGHHTSAHRLVHHRFVATPDDPNSAEAGESFYAFAARAWPGAFIAGYEMENHLREGAQPSWRQLHPYTTYLAGSVLCLILIGLIAGFTGVLAWLLLCAHAQIQLLLSDYVQHYGLTRRRTGPDSYEPFGPQHSWDAPDVVSGLMMLNAPRHADHHGHPARPYPSLELSPGGQAPILPWSLPVMATVALMPGLWRRIMDPRLKKLATR